MEKDVWMEKKDWEDLLSLLYELNNENYAQYYLPNREEYDCEDMELKLVRYCRQLEVKDEHKNRE